MAEEKKPKGEKKPKVKKPKEEKKVEEKIEKNGKKEKPTTEEKPKEVKEKPKEEKENAKEEEKKSEGGDDKKDSKEEKTTPPPPAAAEEIVLRVFMHCEGCVRKVRRCLKGFDGIKEVTTDCKTHKVVVIGEKTDPLKVLDRLLKKTHRQVDLLSPIPPPPVEEVKKPKEKEPPKPQEPKVITVVLKVHMHCEACSLEIKRRIERMKEVEEAIPDLQNSQVTVKGTFDPPKLVEYVYKRTGRHATIVNQDPPPEKKDDDKGKGKDDKGKDGKKEKKEELAVEEKKVQEKSEEPKVKQKKETKGGSSKGGDTKPDVDKDGLVTPVEGAKMVELKTNEFQYYPPSYAMEMYAYPPQIFSDENPNACSIM